MATKAQLELQGRSIAKKIHDIQNDEAKTGAEKSAALDAVQDEWEAHVKAVESCERASDMAAKLGNFGDSAEDAGSGDFSPASFRAANPFAANTRSLIATQLVNSKAYREITDFKGKSEFDRMLEVSTKATDAASNLMGELVAGATGPSAIGQAPFGAGSFAPGILPTFLPGIVEQLFYELTLSDLISSLPVTTPNISYLTENAGTFSANATAENGSYPFSSDSVSRVYEQIGKVANAMTLTDEAIRDAAYLYNFVQGRLLLGIQRQEEIQLLAGGGYPGVNGLLNRSTTFTQTTASSVFSPSSGAAVTNVVFPPANTAGAGVASQTISSLRYGRTVTGATGVFPTAGALAENILDAFVDIELAVFKKPNAIIMHPRDWEKLRIAKDSQNQYYGGSFFGADYGYGANTGKSLWNTPVVTTPLMPQNSILTGWFDPSTLQAARREGISMQMTNSNGTDFVQGHITIRAEERLGLLVYRPSAFQLIRAVAG